MKSAGTYDYISAKSNSVLENNKASYFIFYGNKIISSVSHLFETYPLNYLPIVNGTVAIIAIILQLS